MPRNPGNELGRVTCNLQGKSVVAGSYQTCQLQYQAGFAGIDDTGSLKIVTRYATDAGRPQFNDPSAPNYVTAVASNGAHLQLRYDLKDNVRPWGKTVHLKVLQGYLKRGETITITFGDTSGGSPGWRMQTFQEPTFEMRVLVDRYATYVYEQVPKPTVFRIVPGEPVKLVAIAPSFGRAGKKITVRTKLEDAWGNPVGNAGRFVHEGFDQPGCHTISAHDDETGLLAETNPILISEENSRPVYWADLHGQSEETIGTNSIEEYFRFARDFGFLDACGHQGNDFQITDDFWRTIQQTTAKFNKPRKFVAFPGWEWSGNTGLGGDRNIFFKQEGGFISRSSRALVSEDEAADDCSHDVEALFQTAEQSGDEVMIVPHVGGRYADITRHREGLEPVVEVHSAWGTFEWMLEDAFEAGYRVGIVANSDGHKGRPGASYPGASTFGSYGGLTGIIADKLDRDHVWEAYQHRRVYATTGARILLSFEAQLEDGGLAPMGSVVPVEPAKVPTFQFEVHGTAPIERIEIRNAMRVLRTIRPNKSTQPSQRIKLLWQGAEVRGRGRQVTWDGSLQLTGNRILDVQTINFHNVEKVCRQTSVRRLEWDSTTTGGVAGLILNLERPESGQLDIETSQAKLSCQVADLGRRTKSAGGLAKQLSVYRLPPANGERSMQLQFTPTTKQLQQGDNPLYIHVVQEDGHMAWSSPIFLELTK